MTRTPSHGRRVLAAACGLALAFVPAPAAQARIGDLDPAFDGDGIALPGVGGGAAQFEAVTTLPSGAPIVAGWATDSGGIDEAVVAQLDTAGLLDPGFGNGGVTRIDSSVAETHLRAVARDGSGRVLAAGDTQAASTAPITPIVVRFSPTGVPEPAANYAGAVGLNSARAHAVLPRADGSALVAGWSQVTPTLDAMFVARLTPTGDPDLGFGDDGITQIAGGRAEAMAVDSSGRIVLAGRVSVTLGNQVVIRPALARLDENGTPDGNFGPNGVVVPNNANPEGSPDGELRAVQVDGAGRIIAAGFSGRHAFVTRRLDNGAPDTAFGSGGATFGTLEESAALGALALDGTRTVVAGRSFGVASEQILLGSIDAAGGPEPALGGAPPGWRTFPISTRSAALDVALGPAGTVYSAGSLASPNVAYVSRHLPNAAPAAALAGPAQAQAGAPAVFDAASSSDPEGEALRFAFDLDGDGTHEFDGGQDPLAVRGFPTAGTHTVGVQVTDPRGASATTARSIVVTAVAAPPPRPVLGRQGVAEPVRGIVRYRLPGTKRFVRLTQLSAIPNGTEIDARKGRVLLTVLHDASGRLDAARFYAGRFIFNQGQGKAPVTTLRLAGGSFAGCGAKNARRARSALAIAASVNARAAAKSRKKPVRKLWGDGRGRFRTKGRYGAATVRGTKWLTADRCDGTLVRVERGKVSVDDLVRSNRRPKLVRAGGKTLVAAKRGR